MDYFCSAYFEGEPVQICCEDCRRVRCPYIAKFEFASPKGGSVEKKNTNSGSNHNTSPYTPPPCPVCGSSNCSILDVN